MAAALKCKWLSEAEALRAFATHSGKTESAGHIKPLHWYIACRLVIEGGFNPDWISPRPPFKVVQKGKKKQRLYSVRLDPSLATGSEATVLGGLKTKNVDVVVSIPGIGPVLAVSCKGVTKAFRNLTNRMEETIGECTNLHITYPAMVIGYFAVLRANRTLRDAQEAPELDPADDAAAETPESQEESDTADDDAAEETEAGPEVAKNDLAFSETGKVAEGIERFHAALSQMTGRRSIRDEVSRYEAMTIVMVEARDQDAGAVFTGFPAADSNLHLSSFFNTLYQRYEERFVIGAPALATRTGRWFWEPESPALGVTRGEGLPLLDYNIRFP